MKIFRYIFLLLAGLLLSQAIAAQTVLTGIVRDKATNQPLIGANVFIVNANNRTLDGYVANKNGEYLLKIPSDAADISVVFSFVGYRTQVIKYTTQKTINILLEEDKLEISAVSVTGKRVERDITGLSQRESIAATQRMSMDFIDTAPVTSVFDALQGGLANVDVVTGADPGSKSSIRIRGTSSLNASNEPLFVVDGVPFPVELEETFSFATANAEDYGQLLNITPADIESIEVLKDAMATAVWGSRGANGVLLINTKRGAKGKLKFDFRSTATYLKESNTIPLLNGRQYRAMIQDAIWNSANDVGYKDGQKYVNLLYDTKEIGNFPDWQYYKEYNQDTKWVDEITRPSISTDNTFSMSGGGDKILYRLALSYTNDQGTTIGTNFNRYTARLNLTYNFSNKFKITTEYYFARGIRDANWEGSGSNFKTPRGEALIKMPNMSPYVIGADGSRMSEYFTPYQNFQGGYIQNSRYNPVASVYEAVNRSTSNDNNITFSLLYKLAPGLDLSGIYNMSIGTSRKRVFVPETVTGVTWVDDMSNGSSEGLSDQTYLTSRTQLVYNKELGENHRLFASLALTTADQVKNNQSISVSAAASGDMSDPTAGGRITGMESTTTNFREAGILSTINYTLFKNYNLQYNYRREASSSISSSNRWKGFSVMGANWIFSDETFMDGLKWLDFGKVYFSYGKAGKGPDNKPYSYIGVFAPENGNYINMPAISPSRVDLQNLDYEIKTSYNGGITFEFFKSALTMTLDVYDETNRNILRNNIQVPTSTGYNTYAYYNSGSINNRGWDYSLSYFPVRNNKWKVQFDFNIAQNQNKIISLPINGSEEKYTFGNGEYATKYIEGDPLGSFYGHRYLGVYQNVADTYMKDSQGRVVCDFNGKPIVMTNGDQMVFPGDAKYEDINGDGKIDMYDVVYLGNSNPTLLGGFNFTVGYKGFTLRTAFFYRYGQMVINKARMNLESMYNTNNQGTSVLRRWRSEGDDTDIPRALYDRGYNYLGSDRFVEEAWFIRLNRLTLEYKVPQSLLRNSKINAFSIYVTAYNLWTITKYTGQDPEVQVKDQLAIDGANNPKPVKILAGLNFTF